MADRSCCKVSKSADKYDITAPDHVTGDLDDYLASRWKGTGQGSRISFRELAEWFNKLVLKSAYQAHDRDTGNPTINSEYRVLNDEDDVEEYERVGLLTDLENAGIDGEEIASDFISFSTMSRHIRNCLNVENPNKSANAKADPKKRVRRETEELESRIDEILKPHANRGELEGIVESELEVLVYLSCPHCPTRVSVDRALDKGFICDDHHQSVAMEAESPMENSSHEHYIESFTN